MYIYIYIKFKILIEFKFFGFAPNNLLVTKIKKLDEHVTQN